MKYYVYLNTKMAFHIFIHTDAYVMGEGHKIIEINVYILNWLAFCVFYAFCFIC